MTFRSLTPLIAHKYWACGMPRAVVSLSTWEQVKPEHCSTLWLKTDSNVFSVITILKKHN